MVDIGLHLPNILFPHILKNFTIGSYPHIILHYLIKTYIVYIFTILSMGQNTEASLQDIQDINQKGILGFTEIPVHQSHLSFTLIAELEKPS